MGHTLIHLYRVRLEFQYLNSDLTRWYEYIVVGRDTEQDAIDDAMAQCPIKNPTIVTVEREFDLVFEVRTGLD